MSIFGDEQQEPRYERIAPTKWREISALAPQASQAPNTGLPRLGPSDEQLLASFCANSQLVREAAYAAGQAGMPLDDFLSLMELPPEAGPPLKADLERGKAHTMLAMARVATNGALRGDSKLLLYWLKARGGPSWQDVKPQDALQGQQQVTQVIINTGVPSADVTLTKRDYERIPELRQRDTNNE